MKYIINESRLPDLIDKLFIKRYNGLLKKEKDNSDYIRFFDVDGGKPFELNQGGTLWINDYIFLKKLRNIFGLEKIEEVLDFFKNYFEDKYDVNVKFVASEGGYSRYGDDLDEADPYWNNDADYL